MNRKIVVLFVILLKYNMLSADTAPSNDVWITIFVHGIISIKPHLTITNFLRFLSDQIDDTVYQLSVGMMRVDPFFYQNQAIQGLGLLPINITEYNQNNASALTAYLFEWIASKNQQTHTENLYYTFGWSGLMSHRARYDAAKIFYQELLELRDNLKKIGINPKFRIIGYSHGGNVILNLANIKQHKSYDPSLTIDEIVLYGMPVQRATSCLIADEMFKKVYNIYSLDDRVQQIDVFSYGECFSRRSFRCKKTFELPEKLTQIELHILRKAGSRKKCPKYFSDSYRPNGTLRSHLIRDTSPGHTELWFFGWTPANYRKTYPLYPLPTLIVIPYILNNLATLQHLFNPKKPIIVKIDPDYGYALFKSKYDKTYHRRLFIHPDEIEQYKKETFSYKPENFSALYYNYKISVAVDEAHLIHRQMLIDRNLKNPAGLL